MQLRDLDTDVWNRFFNFKNVRENPPEVLVTSGQKFCSWVIYIVVQSYVPCFKYFVKRNQFITTPMSKTNAEVHMKQLKKLVK